MGTKKATKPESEKAKEPEGPLRHKVHMSRKTVILTIPGKIRDQLGLNKDTVFEFHPDTEAKALMLKVVA